MNFYGFPRELRATGIEAALREQQSAEEQLVEADQLD